MSCSVCSIPCDKMNYGISCCRACAAFYRRTVHLKLSYICRFKENCDISNKNRYSCRKCRMDKCIKVGMDRFGRSEGSPNSQHSSTDEEFQPSTSFMNDSAMHLIRKINDIFHQAQPKKHFPSSLCRQALNAYREYLKKWPDRTKDKLKFNDFWDLSQVVEYNNYALPKTAEFFSSIFPFSNLPIDQMWLVFRNSWRGFTDIDNIFVTCQLVGWDINDRRCVMNDGTVLDIKKRISYEGISDIQEPVLRKLWTDTKEARNRFSTDFRISRPDEMEIAYLILRTIWNDLAEIDGISETTEKMAKNARMSLSEDLHNYYTNVKNIANYASRIYKLENMLISLKKYVEKSKTDGQAARLFNVFKSDVFMDQLR